MIAHEHENCLTDVADFNETLGAFRPRRRVRFSRWCVDNLVTNEGRPYDHAMYPHIAAPGGPADAIDDYRVRTISCQFATRLSKTLTGQALLLFTAATNPKSMLLASEQQATCEGVIGRTYQMLYKSSNLRHLLSSSNEASHKSDFMSFRECFVKGAWARSPGRLADENIQVGMANEIDKPGWDLQSTSKEGSPAKLFEERFKDNWASRKVYYECTPTIAGHSRIERHLKAGTNCRLYVPCPHCKRYQVLRIGARAEATGKILTNMPGRLAWSTDRKGDWETAEKTAYYVCISGKCRPIRNQHRRWMMRHGVWAPEGTSIDDKKAMKAAKAWYKDLTRTIATDGLLERFPWDGWQNAPWVKQFHLASQEHASYQLSSLYALKLTWGDIAAEFVRTVDNAGEFRNFVNSWLGETWELVKRKQTWQQLGEKVVVKIKPKVVPKGYSIVTAGIDKQSEDTYGNPYPFVVNAWNPDRACHKLDYGYFESLEQLEKLLLTKFEHQDGNAPCHISRALMDSGFRPKEVAPFVKSMRKQGVKLFMCKGSSRQLRGPYENSMLGKRSATPGLMLVQVDTWHTQDWIDEILHKDPEDPERYTIYQGDLIQHQDLLIQLLNDAPIEKEDSRNNVSLVWERIDRADPNDYRDCDRYAYIAMLAETRNARIRERETMLRGPQQTRSQGQRRGTLQTPDGQPFFVLER